MKTCKDCIHYTLCKDEFPIYVSDHEDDMSMDTECEYCKDKEKFIELPCNVGDTVFAVIDCYFPQYASIATVPFAVSLYDSIGKTVFLTKEEAEKALEERRDK